MQAWTCQHQYNFCREQSELNISDQASAFFSQYDFPMVADKSTTENRNEIINFLAEMNDGFG